jgi:regulator of sirC expression with transglutaminase-like and TPR domain
VTKLPPEPGSSTSWSPASGRREIEAALRRLGARDDGDIDLAGAALWLAALDRPRVGLERYHHHIDLLAKDTAARAAQNGAESSLGARVEALNGALRQDHGYRGDRLTYDDPQNANLMRVIDRRKGLPVALGILYVHAARAQGWAIEGLNFPGHFLLRLDLDGARVILDPFDDGAVRGPNDLRDILRRFGGEDAELRPEYTQAASNREILLRLRNNIKLRLLRDGKTQAALEVLESMLMVAPGQAGHWREAGLIHAHLGNLRAAVMALEHVLDLGASPREMHETAHLLQSLKKRLN